jgi:hypothetical protein
MKLLAILKDSFREAIDTRVFYLLVMSSCALILVFTSLSVTPSPAKEVLPAVDLALSGVTTRRPGGRDPHVTLDDSLITFRARGVEPLDGAPDRPTSPLRFTITARFVAAGAADEARARPEAVADLIRERLAYYGTFRVFEVTDVHLIDPAHPPEAAPPQDVWFEATVRPTRLLAYIWPHEASLGFGTIPLGAFWRLTPTKIAMPPLGHEVYILVEILVNSLGSWGALLLSIVATAFFIPSMMQKGTLDLLLVKPLERWRLLIYKYLGGLGFIGINASFAVIGLWLIIGLRTGIWCWTLLILIPVIVFCFAVLYSISTLVAILTHSSVVAMLITCLVWALIFGVGRGRTELRQQYAPPGMLHVSAQTEPVDLGLAVLDVVHFVLPRTHDLGMLTSELVGSDLLPELPLSAPQEVHPALDWLESVSVSLVFIAVMLALACLRFCTKDY